MGILRERIAIDLGTAYSIVAHESSDRLWRIPSSIALDATTKVPVAFGEQAKNMMGKGSVHFEVVRPMKDGVISDFEAAGHYLTHLVKKSRKNPLALHYNVLVCVPWGATAVEVRSYMERVQGFRTSIEVIREPFAAALGCDLDVFSSEGCTVMDIGGGTVEVSTISHGHMIHCSSIRAAGNSMDQMIMEKVLRNKFFEIGVNTAEDIKMNYGSVFRAPNELDSNFEVRGLDRQSGLPARLHLQTSELREYLEPLAEQIESRLRLHINHLPPEQKGAVQKDGIHIVGGGAHLKGWKERLEESLQVKISIANDPQFAVIRGMKKIIQHPKKYRAILRISEQGHAIQ